jgi:hypothetical protein
MVRPDLRTDMVGIPEISGPQEKEKEMWSTQREHLHHGGGGGPQSLVGNLVPRYESEQRNERERSWLCV